MSLQKILAAASVENALPRTFTPSKSKMAIEPVLANQTSAKTWRVAGLANCAWHRTEDRRQTTENNFGFRIANFEFTKHIGVSSKNLVVDMEESDTQYSSIPTFQYSESQKTNSL